MPDYPNGLGDGKFVRYGAGKTDLQNPVVYGADQVVTVPAPGGVISPSDRLVIITGNVASQLLLPLLATVPIGHTIQIVPDSTIIPVPVLTIVSPDGAGSINGSFASMLLAMGPSEAVVLTSCGTFWTASRELVLGNTGVGTLNKSVIQQDSEHTPAGTPLTVVTAGTWYEWTSGGGAIIAEPFITEVSPGKYTVNNVGGGFYSLMAHAAINAPAAAVVEMAILFNGAANANAYRTSNQDAATPLREMVIVGETLLLGGVTVSLAFTSDTNGDVLSLVDVQFSIKRS